MAGTAVFSVENAILAYAGERGAMSRTTNLEAGSSGPS
jgi:hypothetical protein